MPWSRIQDIDHHWNDLTWKFEHILDGDVIKQEDWFQCFPQVFQLLTSVDTDSLDKVHERLYSFFRKYLSKLARRIREENDDNLLLTYRHVWVTYRDNLQKISKVFGTLLFEPYKSSAMLPSALYLPSLSTNSDEIQSDAEISSVYDIGVLYWQNVIVKPHSERLIRILMETIKKTWTVAVNADTMEGQSDQEELESVIIDVALTFSQRPGQLFAAIRGLNVTADGSSEPVSSEGHSSTSPIMSPANLLVGPLLAVQSSIRSLTGDSGSISAGSTTKSNESPARSYVLAYHHLLKEFAVLSHALHISLQTSSDECRQNLTHLSRFISLENARINKLFGQSLVAETTSLMENIFFGGERKVAIENFLANEARQRGLCQEVALLFAKVSVLPSGRKMAISVLANYISGLSKMLLDNRPSDVASSPELFVSYFGGQLMNLRKTVETTFVADGMFRSLEGAVTRAAEDVLAELNSENLCPEDFTARYIDVVLKKSSSADPESPEFQKKLENFVGIFTYLTEKTLYQKYHAKLLFRRLVFGLSPTLELERKINRCMAEICSPEYCVYLNRTIAEVERSLALSKDYVAAVASGEAGTASGITPQQANKLSALVLSQHIWPLGPAPVSSLRLPKDFQRQIDEFTAFYVKKKDRAKLTWLNGYAIVEIRMLYAQPKPVTLIANIAYGAVLLTFADCDSRSFSWLAEATGLSSEELNRVCSNLVDQKLLTLTSSPSPDRIYSLNLAFTSRSTKMRLLTLGPISSAAAAAASQAPATPKSPIPCDTSMDLDQSRDSEPTIGRAAIIEKLVIEAREHVSPQFGFTCTDLLRCVLARPELKFTPSTNEVHLCLQRLATMGVVDQVSPPQAEKSHSATYKFTAV